MISYLKNKVKTHLEPPEIAVLAEPIENGFTNQQNHQYLFSPLPIDRSSDDFPTTAAFVSRRSSCMSMSVDESMDSPSISSLVFALENYLDELFDIISTKHKSDKVARIISLMLLECNDALLRIDEYKDIAFLPIPQCAIAVMKLHPKADDVLIGATK